MSIEALLTSLKESVDRNTEALLAVAAAGGKAAATEGAGTKTSGKAGKKSESAAATESAAPSGPKHTQDEVNAALIKIKDDFGIEHAKSVIKSAAGVDKMGDIPADKYDAVFDAAVKKHAELTAEAIAVVEEGGL